MRSRDVILAGEAHVHPALWGDCHRVRGRQLVNLFGEGGAGHARALLRLQSCSGFGSSKPFGSAISDRGSRFGDIILAKPTGGGAKMKPEDWPDSHVRVEHIPYGLMSLW